MAGSTPDEAVRAFVGPIQDILKCFLKGKVTTDSSDPAKPGILTLNRAEPVQVFGEDKLQILLQMNYLILNQPDQDEPWKVSTTGWIYHLLDRNGARLLGYHWHPLSALSPITEPHVHVQPRNHHLPTGRILIEDVLFASVEYGAEPRDRAEWLQIDAANRELFAGEATWGAGTRPV